MSNESSSILSQIDKALGAWRLYVRRLQLRINEPNISAIEKKMAERMQLEAHDQTVELIRNILRGDQAEIPERDHHAHINLVPELELEI